MADPSDKPLPWFSEEYFEMNGTHLKVLSAPPTALEFSRLVHISRPVLIKGFDFPALHRWSDEYLVEQMGNRRFSVAVTPNGHADAVTLGPDGRQYFAEPYVQEMTMDTFLPTLSSDAHNIDEIHYLQSQNGNLFMNTYFKGDSGDRSQFEPLRRDVPPEVPWCSEALGRSPDAVNLWIGDSRSVTSVHNDPYENIYTVARGSKHFTLLPPTESWCLKERNYPHARFIRSSSTTSSELVLEPSQDRPVRWSSILDPCAPGALPPQAHPIHITVSAGETLYLPPGWWHYVRQSKEITIALNWWYDIESQGMDWVLLRFLRGPDEVPGGNEDVP